MSIIETRDWNLSAGNHRDEPVFPMTAWGVIHVMPTLFVVPHIQKAPPSADEVVSAIETASGESCEVKDSGDVLEDGVVWELDLGETEWGRPAFLYAQASPEWFAKMVGHPQAGEAPWIVGCKLSLDPVDPVGSYSETLRMLARAFPAAPFVHDTVVERCHDRGILKDLLRYPGLTLAQEQLWNVDTVHRDDGGPGPGWLHTHGLARCGRIDLELLEIPRSDVEGETRLLQLVADRVLNGPAPRPGEVFRTGSAEPLELQPWQLVAGLLPPEAIGSTWGRCEICPCGHTEDRAVISTRDPATGLPGSPQATVEALARREELPRLSAAATNRTARCARALWSAFERVFGQLADPRLPRSKDAVRFQVRAAVPGDMVRPEALAEPTWVEVISLSRREEIRTLTVARPRGPRSAGLLGTLELDLQQVDDWRVETPTGTYGPQEVGALDFYCSLAVG